MKKPLAGALLALALLGLGAAPAAAAPAQAPRATAPVRAPGATAVGFAGTVALDNCSGSVVRLPRSRPDDRALVLSNGHCLESGMPAPGTVVVDRPSTRGFGLLNSAGTRVATLRASRIAYATMTGTDVSLYELTTTYRQIEERHRVRALELDTVRPARGTSVKVVSGYWKRIYGCSVDGFAHRLEEGDWTWTDSVRYTAACDTIGGTSGAPVIDTATGRVVAVNNTRNESGGRCTVNNPCEVDENGTVTVHRGIGYAQQTYTIAPCVGAGNRIDLDRPGCALPKP
ncbi:S1 family peptidase [Streptomyces somaliensis]|uniref:Trypsin-like peptidase domain-containing protein n=1 Tax=Streptomyces somaliensis (strain ATCC 33201 / DSM 40738 / JCM 12659 / KCTC 9044 / NCTC 11332 / NRRL B-12077 / IP 733) TaxID=1134445 RepID=A0AA44DGS1_STRE0|nr:serine protease [Streptomyces somaliensis]NKY16140.1 trypsin-like peptidase domain-containing protein [Streptomyces somaliensis DSM 40738]